VIQKQFRIDSLNAGTDFAYRARAGCVFEHGTASLGQASFVLVRLWMSGFQNFRARDFRAIDQ